MFPISLKKLKLKIENGVLTLSGEQKEEKKESSQENGSESYMSTSTFVSRSITLPTNIDEGTIQAKYEKGDILITLPKVMKEEKEKNHIPIH